MTLSDKRLLITGAGGYIGSALIARLIADGVSFKTAPQVYNIVNWSGYLDNVDIVVYLAAQTDAGLSNLEPMTDLAQNVMPFLSMLIQMKASQKVVFAGSATQVGYTNFPPYHRAGLAMNDKPETVYDIHKLTCEHYLRVFGRGVSLRLTNVYGPSTGESSGNSRGVFNKMVRQALKTGQIEGSAGVGRDFVYIDDVVDAFVRAAEKIERLKHSVYLIGSGQVTSVQSAAALVADSVKKVTGKPVEVKISQIKLSKLDQRLFAADSSSFKSETGWLPKTDIVTGIEKTVRYYA